MEELMSNPELGQWGAYAVYYGIPLTIILVLAAAALAFVLPILMSLLNVKISVKSIIGIVAVLALIFITYGAMPGEGWELFNTAKYAQDGITETISLFGTKLNLMKYAETCIFTTGILLVIATVAAFGLSIINFILGLF